MANTCSAGRLLRSSRSRRPYSSSGASSAGRPAPTGRRPSTGQGVRHALDDRSSALRRRRRDAIWQIQQREPSRRQRDRARREARPALTPAAAAGDTIAEVDLDVSFWARPRARPPPGGVPARCSSGTGATACSWTAAKVPSASCCAPRSASSTWRTSSSPTSTPTTISACRGCSRRSRCGCGNPAHRLRAGGLRDLFGALSRVVGKVTYRSSSSSCDTATLSLARLSGLRLPVPHGVPAVGYALVEDARPAASTTPRPTRSASPSGPSAAPSQRGDAVTLPDGRVVQPEELVGTETAGPDARLHGGYPAGRGRRWCCSPAPTC